MLGSVEARQPAIRVPLQPGLILRQSAHELTALKPDLTLWLEIGPAGQSPWAVRFRVDSGCEVSSVGVEAAATLGIPFPPDGAPEYDLGSATAGGAGTARVRPGRIRVWWTADRQGEPFDWPVLFVVGPTARRVQKPLLGLGGVVPTWTWTVVGPRSAAQDDGFVAFEDVRPV